MTTPQIYKSGTFELRDDYVDFISAWWAANVRDSLRAGYIPSDWRHLSADYWRKELRKRGF
jgi:hypothetical protein